MFIMVPVAIQFEHQALVEPTLEFHSLEKGPVHPPREQRGGNLRITMDRGGSSGG